MICNLNVAMEVYPNIRVGGGAYVERLDDKVGCRWIFAVKTCSCPKFVF